MTSPYLDRPARTEAQARRDLADARPDELRMAYEADPVAVLRNLVSAVTEMMLAAERVDRMMIVSRLSLDLHYAVREAERRAEAEIAARMTS